MSLSVETLAVARKYTDDSLAGAGAVAGVPCKIQSITAITGGNRVTFLWTDNNGDDHTSAMDVMNGVDGEDGKGIQSVTVNAQDHLIITYTDGTTVDAGEIEIHNAVDSVNGQTGAVVLDAEDVGALPDNTPIPSKTSDLTNDSGFATTSDVSTALADYTTTVDLTTLLAAKQDTLTFDNAPTENSNNPVKSGGVYASNQTLTNQVKDMNNVYGSKNLLIIRQYTRTFNGVSITVNDDGSISFKGTPSAAFNLSANTRQVAEDQLENDWVKPFLGKECIFSSDIDYDVTSANITIAYKMTASDTLHYIPSGSRFTFNEIPYLINVSWYLPTTLSFDTTWKPMIRLASIEDDTYEPYAKTNQQLTQDTTALLDNTEVNGAVNYIYPVESTKTDSAGVTWTLNSDNSVSVSSGGVAPSTGSGFSYRNNNAAFLRGKTVTFKANVTGNTPTYDKLYFAVICRETENGANLVRYDVWPTVGQTEVTFTVPNNTNYILIGCNIQNGATTAIDCKISPIVSLASYNGDYVPYAKSNRELTDELTIGTVSATRNTDYLNGTNAVTFRKYGKMVSCEGYFQVTTAAARNGVLYTLAELPLASSFLLALKNTGEYGLLNVKPNGTVIVESENGLPIGFYSLIGTFVLA